MGTNRILNDQGTLVFKELASNGTAGVTVQSTADLTGASGAYTLTLPTTDGGVNEFLQTDGSGVLSWGTSTSTLQSSYDNGGKITTAGGVPVEIEVGAASANVGLLIDQDDDFKALDITKDGAGAGDAIAVLNSGTGRGLFIDQDGAAIGLLIDQDGAAVALSVDQAAVAADAVSVVNAGTGRGLFIDQDGAAIGLDIDQDGAGIGFRLNQATASDAVEVTQAGNGIGLDINKTGSGAGNAVDIANAGTGVGLYLNQTGVGVGVEVLQDTADPAMQLTCSTNIGGSEGVLEVTKSGSSAGRGIFLTNDGTGEGLFILQSKGVSGTGSALFIQQNSTSNGKGAEIKMFGAGTGAGLLVNHDGNGIALDIDSEATSQPLINLAPVAGNSRGDIAFGTGRTSDPGSPAEGDMWYQSTDNRFSGDVGGSKIGTIASAFGQSYGAASLRTITTGSTPGSAGNIVLAAESGTADDLDTIADQNILLAFDTVMLRADTGDTITVKHGTGNILLDGSADKALVNNNVLTLIWDGSNWLQQSAMMVLP